MLRIYFSLYFLLPFCCFQSLFVKNLSLKKTGYTGCLTTWEFILWIICL